MKITFFITALLVLLFPLKGSSNTYELESPDRLIRIVVDTEDQLKWSVYREGERLLLPSTLGMRTGTGRSPGYETRVRRSSETHVSEMIEAAVPVKNRYIDNTYNQLLIEFRDGYSVEFRAYDNGAAYRFITDFPESSIDVMEEEIEFNFEANHRFFWPVETSPTFQSHYENLYRDIRLAALGEDEYGALPMLMITERNTHILLTEADLYDYPNFFLFGSGSNRLRGEFPPVIKQSVQRGDRQEIIVENEDFIARTAGRRSYPWRIMKIETEAAGLLENELVYKLSSPNVLSDTDWIVPGKVAWDWWNANNIYGVDFRAGINTDTYKYYIDFASAYGLDYIILDEGWTITTQDLTRPNPDIDIEELFAYAEQKDVGIVLWVLWNALDRELEGALDRFASWGAKGIKVDFMVRADQGMVNYYERVARAAAERELLVNFHGSYKPVGLNRKYPNVLTYEGVQGLENQKWSDNITPGHNVTLPFIRMAAGPMDYTPGAMINATRDNFCIRYTEPMSQGTRAHQAAMYVMYESPMQMLADNPSNYLREPEYTGFISRMPVIWDKTIGLGGSVGEYAAVARKKEDQWYIGAMTNWQERSLELDTDFLDDNTSYRIEFVKDGPNADRQAMDHIIGSKTINAGDKIIIELAEGGGFAAILTPVQN